MSMNFQIKSNVKHRENFSSEIKFAGTKLLRLKMIFPHCLFIMKLNPLLIIFIFR